jgi:two-component system, OmpR family, catabolic regulation response regulator CreB
MKPKILIVEDESSIAETLLYALKTDGFAPVRVATGADALRVMGEGSFALIILDVGLPDVNGFELCKQIRKSSDVPVFFLTARSDEVDKIVGLEIGADDYITKPFSPREVTARVKSLLRRLDSRVPATHLPAAASTLFEIDEDKFRMKFRGRVLELTRYEFGLLKMLVRKPGRVFSREQLMEQVWDEPDMALDRTVDTHVKSLRNKLREVDPETEVIVTHRGLGYSIREDLK